MDENLRSRRSRRKQKVTLRRIASHTAGLTVYGFGGYAVGAEIPSLPQILDGLPPANSPPVRFASVPESNYSYSGGGTTVEQQLMIDVSGQTFPAHEDGRFRKARNG
jgi:CubicO group peptidase (beta-lactamase class C family)